MDPAFQESFNVVKGLIPARTDIKGDKFDICGQKSMADLAQAEKNGTLFGSLSQGQAQPSAVQRAMFDVVTEHFNSDMSSQDAVDELVAAVEAATF